MKQLQCGFHANAFVQRTKTKQLPKPHVAILEVDFLSSLVPQENCFSRNLDSTSFCLEGKNRLHNFIRMFTGMNLATEMVSDDHPFKKYYLSWNPCSSSLLQRVITCVFVILGRLKTMFHRQM